MLLILQLLVMLHAEANDTSHCDELCKQRVTSAIGVVTQRAVEDLDLMAAEGQD